MKEQPIYKSLKLPFAAWQALTRIAARTGETRSGILVRLIRSEERKDKTVEYALSSSQEARIRFDDLCYRSAMEDVKSYIDEGGDLSDIDLDAYWIMFDANFNPGYDDADEAHARFMDQYRKVLAEYR